MKAMRAGIVMAGWVVVKPQGRASTRTAPRGSRATQRATDTGPVEPPRPHWHSYLGTTVSLGTASDTDAMIWDF